MEWFDWFGLSLAWFVWISLTVLVDWGWLLRWFVD